MNTTSKKTTGVKGGLRKLIINEFFVTNKTLGLREGFRRLALLLGGAGFVWTYANSYPMADYISALSSSLGLGMDIAGALAAVIVFFVIASITKTVGWVIEGFVR